MKNDKVIKHSNAFSLATSETGNNIFDTRVWIYIVSEVDENDPIDKQYTINIKEIAETFAITKGEHPDIIKDTFLKIKENNSYLFYEEETEEFVSIPLLAEVRYQKGSDEIKYQIGEKFRPHLFDLQKQGNFTLYLLSQVRSLSKQRDLALYLILASKLHLRECTIKITALKEMLNIKDEAYPVFKDFRKRVLDSIKKRFTSGYSDITFEYELLKTGRKFTHIRFHNITRKEAVQEQINFEIRKRQNNLLSQIEQQLHILYGANEAAYNHHNPDYIQWTVNKCEAKRLKGKIKGDPAAYFRTVIENDQNRAEWEIDKNKKNGKNIENADNAPNLTIKEKADIALKAFGKLPEEKQSVLIKEFENESYFTDPETIRRHAALSYYEKEHPTQ